MQADVDQVKHQNYSKENLDARVTLIGDKDRDRSLLNIIDMLEKKIDRQDTVLE